MYWPTSPSDTSSATLKPCPQRVSRLPAGLSQLVTEPHIQKQVFVQEGMNVHACGHVRMHQCKYSYVHMELPGRHVARSSVF